MNYDSVCFDILYIHFLAFYKVESASFPNPSCQYSRNAHLILIIMFTYIVVKVSLDTLFSVLAQHIIFGV